MQPQQLMQTSQMMMDKPREEDKSINIVLRSGMMTSLVKGKKHEEDKWVCKYLEKEVDFDLTCPKETLMEAKKSFVEAST